MLLGFLALALVASALLGAAMLIAGFALVLTRTWRSAGMLVLGAGALGASLSVLALFVVRLLLGSSPAGFEAWLLFGAAGFGLAGFFALAAFTVVFLFGRPTRWADRRKGLHA
jgi:hypothetical protein